MTTNEALNHYTQQCQQRVEQALDQLLPSTTTLPTRLHEAMRYATLNGGKRIRPLLVYAAGQALDIAQERLDAPACAVELIHAYSLVHDDLPAMDDDDLRRNQSTCHRAYDEATAILAGDALQSLAFKSLCCDECMQANAQIRLTMVEILARASGSRGMAGGQAIDLQAVGRDLNLAELENLHIHKTGALIHAAVRMSTLINPAADKALTTELDHYAKCIGLAFQIQDDILDVEGDTHTLGKTKGKDFAQKKPTYPSLLGLAGAKEKAGQLLQEALQSLDRFNAKADPLRWIAQYITERKH
ncbi:MAG: (2E,6E)-farnesyl diphosphate synthase [Candidatus Thiodiazotropha sp. (ex Lucinoma aequizonata)]|nr:(2E,6E)-farnesyl diphosphate synthase [Candidatus Thiodiazotropha sp. (ex Lucinoma aequizonata)]MCU7887438.1 (2E,6E)-farnesyl diphosphate synthase [Candidatus Thiodiazotropha sp. (ex Lucinoma aequizonata)]MCU7895042.1 (2E,6E)-farnesyl diphosphate synthase [Candidatus Thiodiazotropha sp. (ex Lucinoma aequizonata)]MCU7900585.1 (2E,6E)-farnesyl diphosphate synthase [Candidatus Thiodiazotropha sp. (ex Lucinoma aequizonata)]MCU7900855.1 (2E,6E)-farnesyl diphosphate synthase [Candidatus Thiodiazot